MLRHRAALRPEAPGQREGGAAGGTAALGQPVQHRVRGGVVALSRPAHGGGQRREQHEHRQVEVLGQLVEQQRAVHLGAQHADGLRNGQRLDQAVLQRAGGVQHTGQRVLGGDRAQQAGQLLPVGDVAGDDRDLGAPRGEVGDEVGRARGVRPAASGQQQVTHAVLGDQVPGQQRAEHAEATGDEHGPGGVERPGHAQHRLADQRRLAQGAERGSGPAHVEGVDPRWVQRALGDQRGDLGQHLAEPVVAGLHQVVDPVADARVVAGDLLGVALVGLAHLQEPAALAEQPQARVDELAGQAVQHHVDAGAAGGRPEGVLEVEGAGAGDALLGDPPVAQQLLLGRARGGVDLQTQVPGQLQRGGADAAGRRVHQQFLPRLDLGEVDQAHVGGEEGDRHRRRLLEGPARRHGHEQALVGDADRAERLGGQAHHPVAHREPGRPGADRGDHAGHLATEPGQAGHQVERDHDVLEVQAGGPDVQPDLALGQVGQPTRVRLQLQALDGARLPVPDPPGGLAGRREQDARPVPAAEPGHPQCAGADRDLHLTGGQCGGQRRPGGGRAVHVDDGEPAGVLGLGGAQQAPHAGAGQVGDARLGFGADRAGGDEHQAGVVAAALRQPALQQFQRGEDGRPGRVSPGGHEHVRGPVRVGDAVEQVVEAGGDGRVGQHVRRQRGTARGEDRPGDRGQLLRCGQLGPAHLVQCLVPGRSQGGLAERAHHQVLGGQHRLARGVGDLDGDRVRAGQRQPDAQPGGAAGVQAHAAPGERQPDVVLAVAEHERRVQGRVEQRRVQAEPGGVRVGGLGQHRLRAHLAVAPPQPAQAPEGGAVAVAGGGHPLVVRRAVDLRQARRRPRGQPLAVGSVRGLGEHAGRVPGPAERGRLVAQPAVDAELAGAVRAGRLHPHLHVQSAGGREHHRHLQRQLVHLGAAHLVAGEHGQVEQAGAGEQHAVADRVVGQPRLAGQVEPAGQHHAVAVASTTAPPSTGWSRGRRPREPASAVPAWIAVHRCWCWKAYVGRSMRRAPGKSAAQSTVAPWTNARASARWNWRTPPLSRTRVPDAVAAWPVSSTICWIGTASIGCGEISRKTVCPSVSSARTADSNSTVCLALRYQ